MWENLLGSSRTRGAVVVLVGASVAAVLSSSAEAQDIDTSRTFCEGKDTCTPARLEVVFPDAEPPGSVFEVTDWEPGVSVDATAVIDAREKGIQAWVYGVRHDATYLELVEGSATTQGTVADPEADIGIAQPAHFEVTRDVDGGFVSAVVLTLTATRAVLPVGQRHLVARANYRVRGKSPGPAGTRIALVHEELRIEGSPPSPISFTIDGTAREPGTLVDGLVTDGQGGEQDCANGVDDDGDGAVDCADVSCREPFGPCTSCDDWAFYFGEDARVAEAGGPQAEKTLAVGLRNAEEALAFQLGVRAEPGEEPDTWRLEFSGDLGGDGQPRIPLRITGTDARSHEAAAGNVARVEALPAVVRRGPALADLGGEDFFRVDLDPSGAGEGAGPPAGGGVPVFTAGWIVDVRDEGLVLPVTENDFDQCPLHEVLEIELGTEPPAPFIRGDVVPDGVIALGDGLRIARVVLGQLSPFYDCEAALDANGDGGTDVSDAVALLGWLFLGEAAPPAPFPGCGTPSPAGEGLPCVEASPACE